MNSFIILGIIGFCKRFAEVFTKSKLWAIIQNLNAFFQKSWKRSCVMGFLKHSVKNWKNSIFVRILFSPFTFLEFAQKRLCGIIGPKIKSSIICETGRVYVESFMAINTRFWGMMVLCATLVFNILHYIKGAGLNIPILILSVIAMILCNLNYNVMRFLNTSKFIDFLKACAGLKNVKFDFFDEKCTKGSLKFVSAIAVGIITGGVMSFMPLYGMLIPFVLFGMILVLRFPITGVYAAVFIAPLIPFSSMPLAGVCLWTLLSLIIKSVTDANFKWKRDGVGAALILFLVILLISCVFSFARTSSLVVWAMYFIFVSFYFAVINTISTKEQLYGLLRLFVISGALVALYGVMQYVFGWTTTNAWIDETMFEDDTMRVFSTLANPNVLGEYLLLVLPVSTVFFLKDKSKTLSKWVYLAITAIVLVCLILTQSRGCWLGFIIAVAIFVTFYEGRCWALIPLVICIIPFVIPQIMIERFASIGNMDDSSTSYRVYIWMGAIGMLRHYIAGGIGMGEGAFNEVYPFFSYNAIIAPHAHNTYLQLLVEGGIPALSVFIAVIVIYLRNTQIIYKSNKKKSLNSAMSLAVGAGMCGFLFQSLFDYTFYNYRVMAVFFMLMGITMAYRNVKGAVDRNEI